MKIHTIDICKIFTESRARPGRRCHRRRRRRLCRCRRRHRRRRHGGALSKKRKTEGAQRSASVRQPRCPRPAAGLGAGCLRRRHTCPASHRTRGTPRVAARRRARLGATRAATGSGGAPAGQRGAWRARGGTGGTGDIGTRSASTGTGTGGNGSACGNGGRRGREAGGVLAVERHLGARRGGPIRTEPRTTQRGEGGPRARRGARAVHVRAQAQHALAAHRGDAPRGYWCAARAPPSTSPAQPHPHRLRTSLYTAPAPPSWPSSAYLLSPPLAGRQRIEELHRAASRAG